MCLITICPKGTEKDIVKIKGFIEQGMQSNTDGSGYSCKKNGKLRMDKGFRTSEELLKSISQQRLSIDDELVIHHRIGTSGRKDSTNMHPFLISEDINVVKTLITQNSNVPIIAHNGVFYQFTNHGSDYSDTFHFVNEFLATPEFISLLGRDPEKFKKVLSVIIGTNRLAILFPDRDLVTVGNFVSDDGFMHSNGGYKKFVFDKGGSSHSSRLANLNLARSVKDDPDMMDEEDWQIYHDSRLGNNHVAKHKGIDSMIEKSNTVKKSLPSTVATIKFKGTDIKITENNYKHFFLIPKDRDFNDFVLKNKAYEIEEYSEGIIFTPIVSLGTVKHINHVNLDNLLTICDVHVKFQFKKQYEGLFTLIKRHGNNPSLSVIKKIKTILIRKFKSDNFKFKGYGMFNWFDLNEYYNRVKNNYSNVAKVKLEEEFTYPEHEYTLQYD